MRRLLDWLHARSGYRAGLSHLLDEPLPPGTGWWFTLGSGLLFLIAVQVVTGAVLTMYYAPTPDHAWESVRFIMRDARLGWLVRGLHFFGASAIVIFMALHLLRVIFFGSYKAPRELTWLTGVALLLVLLAFALTGYLLPWDQRAYWATVVTINLVALPPLIGPALAALVRGGPEIGALTLTRWYSAHVILLPGLLLLLVGLHLFLMRRHGISGPVTKVSGTVFDDAPPKTVTFFPYQAARDVTVTLVVAAVLVALAWRGMPALEAPADPADATYTPRPEWYFLGLFQLLKYFPGRWEIVGALVLPGLALGALALLPWIDRGPERDPRRRRGILAAVTGAVAVVVALTTAGWRDTGRETAGTDGGLDAASDCRKRAHHERRLRALSRRGRHGGCDWRLSARASARLARVAHRRSRDDRARPASPSAGQCARRRCARRLRRPVVARRHAARRPGLHPRGGDDLRAPLRRLPPPRRRRRRTRG